MKPSIGGQHLRGVLRFFEIAFHHMGAAREDFTILRDLHLNAGDRLSHRSKFEAAGAVEGDDRTRFG